MLTQVRTAVFQLKRKAPCVRVFLENWPEGRNFLFYSFTEQVCEENGSGETAVSLNGKVKQRSLLFVIN